MEELHTIWSKVDKQVQSLINTTAQIKLSEDAIKNGMVVEMVMGIIDNTSFKAKNCISHCIKHVNGQYAVDLDFMLVTLQEVYDP